jgi:hypothetical protein
MSMREGRGFVPGLGEFRPAPYLTGEHPWREIRNIVTGLGDDHGRQGPEALAQKLQAVAREAAWEAVFQAIGFRWQELSDRQWLELVLEKAHHLWEIYNQGSPKDINQYIEQSKNYAQTYANLAALLLVWAEAVRFREHQKEVDMKRQ